MTAIPPLQDLDDRSFDPFFADEMVIGDFDDPYPLIHNLMGKGSVHEVNYPTLFACGTDPTLTPFPHYTVTGYDAVVEVLRTPEVFTQQALAKNLGISFGASVSTMDGAQHARFRRIFQKAFLPQYVALWGEKLVDPVVSRLLDPIVARGHGDLIQEFTLHFPFQVIFSMMQLPESDMALFHKLAVAQTSFVASVENAVDASNKLGAYIADLVVERRRKPGEDIVSVMSQVEIDGDRLPDEVIISFFRQLLNAGGDTTYRGTSVLLTGLLTNPEQFAAAREDAKLIPRAIEEGLRWNPPVSLTFRWTARDTVLAGVEIPGGAVIDVSIGSANRDPAHFPDPDRYDIFRANSERHLAFAQGPHLCIGQHLGRLEMGRALKAVVARMPNARLDPAMPPPAIRGIWLRVPKHLHIRCD